MGSGFETGAGISLGSVSLGLGWLFFMVATIALVVVIFGAWVAWTKGSISLDELTNYLIRGFVFYAVVLVLFGIV